MSRKPDHETLQKITNLVKSGHSDDASKALVTFLKKTKINTEQKITISEVYLWLGNLPRAIRILGVPSSVSEINHLPTEDKVLLIRHADLMHFLGANYTANSILQTHGKTFSNDSHQFRYWFTAARLCLTRYDFQGAQLAFENALNVSPKHELSQLGLADALEGLGETSEALKILDNYSTDSKKMMAIVEQMKGEFLVKVDQFSSAEKHFLKAEELFNDKDESKDKAYLYQWWACGLIDSKRPREAVKLLKKARQYILKSGGQSTALIAISYFLWKAGAAKFEDLVCLFLNSTYSPYRACIDCKTVDSLYPYHPWIEKNKMDSKNNLIFLHPAHKKITPVSSSDLDIPSESMLDLQGSLLRTKNQSHSLTEYRVRALKTLIGSGATGVNEYQLWDKIYQSTMWNIDQDLDRLKKLIRELKSLGFEINKSKGNYSIQFESLPDDILSPL